MASRKQCSSQPPKKKHCKITIFFHQAPSSDESTPTEIDTEIDSETEDDAVDVAVVEEPTAGPSTESDHDVEDEDSTQRSDTQHARSNTQSTGNVKLHKKVKICKKRKSGVAAEWLTTYSWLLAVKNEQGRLYFLI